MLFEKCSPNVHSNNSTSQSQDSYLEGLWGERRSRWKTNVYVDYTLWRTPVTGKTSFFLWMNPMCTLNSDWIQVATPNDSLHGGGLRIFHASSNCTTTLSKVVSVLDRLIKVHTNIQTEPSPSRALSLKCKWFATYEVSSLEKQNKTLEHF